MGQLSIIQLSHLLPQKHLNTGVIIIKKLFFSIHKILELSIALKDKMHPPQKRKKEK
jgi:hypothetical protein